MARFLFILLGFLGLSLPAFAQRDARPEERILRDLPFDLNPRNPRPPSSSSRDPTSGSPKADGRSSETNEKSGADPAQPRAPVTLDSLYDRLAGAKDRQEASVIVKQIERRWARSGSETADLLLTRANVAANIKDYNTALELFDHIILLMPEWPEVYHRRATLFFTMNDYEGAVRDLQAALSREPRHFAALSGLGLVFQQMDNKKAALAAFRKALELHPNLENLQDIVKRLTPEVDGLKL